MSDKKNIDTFFQEQFENFEVTPPDTAWENIEIKLNEKKKKRRIIPFWWKFTGIAAGLFLGYLLITFYYKKDTKIANPIVNHQDNGQIQKEKNEVNAIPFKTSLKKEAVVLHPENTNEINPGVANSPKTNKNTIRNHKNQKADLVVQSNKNNSTLKEKLTNELVSTPNSSSTLNEKINVRTEKIADSNYSIDNNLLPKNNAEQNKIKGLVDFEKDKNTITPLVNAEEKIDSTKLASVEPNALEELLKEKEKKIVKESKLNRWQVTPNIAPIFFSSISNGSPLDERLESNKKIYATNYSYGLAVDYSLNKKLNIRSGIHSFSADYDTKGIAFSQNTNASKMQNVNPNLQGSTIQIDPLNYVNSSFGRIEDKFEGTLNQKMGYVEIPLELSYKLLSKKFGIDVIGGVSTLFLSQNDVYLKTSSATMKIGEASNLNTLHFSTNIGLGLKYSFLKRFDARVEPLFKYQLNTYSTGAGNFKPYIFGVYSGISYHF